MTTRTATPPDLDAVAGVTATVVGDHRVRCEVRGPIGPLLRALRDTDVTSLDAREASLEELFLSYYGDDDR